MHMPFPFLSCGCVEGGALCSRRLSIEHEQHVCGVFTPIIEKSTSLDILRFHFKSMTNGREGRYVVLLKKMSFVSSSLEREGPVQLRQLDDD